MKITTKFLVTSALVVMLLAAITGMALALVTVHVHHATLGDVQAGCDGAFTSWHFVINQIDDESLAPPFITVYWDNGQQADVPLNKFTGGVAHYITTDYIGWLVTDATAEIYDDWAGGTGNFNLSSAECGPVDPLDVSKTAIPDFTRTWGWTINKSPDGAYVGFAGDVFTHNYTVSVTPSSEDSDWEVNGIITITNSNDYPVYALVSDAVDNGGSCEPEVDHVTIPSNDSVDVAYTCTWSSEPSSASGTNTATVQWGSRYSYGTADFEFADPVEINPVIHVDDDNMTGEDWSANRASAEWKYSKDFACPTDFSLYTDGIYVMPTHVNTATIEETGADDTASVDLTCYLLQVTKDATTSFTRTYDWTIDKVEDAAITDLTLAVGQDYTVHYTITLGASFTDSDWAVGGNIHVYNPASIAATINSVEDVVSPDISATVDCGVSFPYSLAADDTLDCTYSAALPDASDRTNTATAVLQNTPSGTTDFNSAPVDVLFDENTTITEIDECVHVYDSYAGDLGEYCYGDLPESKTVDIKYPRIIGPYAECGEYQVINVASFLTNDTDSSDSAGWTIDVHVPCPGCTLTIGYWKNHAGFGPQADMVSAHLPQWLGTSGGTKSIWVTTPGKAVQFLSFMGSNNVFSASNGINKLYAQLLGAKLNIAAGADGSAVASTISAADTFLATHNSLDWLSLTNSQKNKVLGWKNTLDQFNTGLIGPGHCSE